jgi:hypothetical protein
MVLRPLALLASLTLGACITPPETGTPSGDGNKPGAAPAAPASEGASGAQGTAPAPPEGPPAGDGQGGPPVPGPGDGPVQMPAFKVTPGEGVGLGGTIAWSGKVGKLRVDVLTKKEDGSPTILHAATLEVGGVFRIEAPKNTGKVTVMAFVDKDGNGPGPNEPAESREVEIGASDVTGLSFDLDTLAAAIGGDFAKGATAASPSAAAPSPSSTSAAPATPASDAAPLAGAAPANAKAAPVAPAPAASAGAPAAAAAAPAPAPAPAPAKPVVKGAPKAAVKAKKKDGATP